MKVLGVIPARGGSKGVKNKNILKMHGKPIIGYTIEAAMESKLLDKIVVSTESILISKIVQENYKVEVIKRPSEFAKDDSPIEQSLLHAVEHLDKVNDYSFDMVVMLFANMPVRKKGIIDSVIKKLLNNPEADSSATCYEIEHNPWIMKTLNKNGRLIPIFNDVEFIRRQEFPKRYLLDGSVVAMWRRNLFETRGIRKAHVYLGNEIVPVYQNKEDISTIEIDNSEDLKVVSQYIELRKKNNKYE